MHCVPLHYKHFPSQKHSTKKLIILHGLLGSARNWQTVGLQLSQIFDVYALDLRNHGSSPHSQAMNHALMVEDLEAFLSDHCKEPVILMGHSLGGKVAMAFACAFPERIRALIVIDIAPRNYPFVFEKELKALLDIPLETLKDRKTIDDLLSLTVPNAIFRQFLLSNLSRDLHQNFFWKPNLKSLLDNLPLLCQDSLIPQNQYLGPTLFMKGEYSDYINNKDIPTIKSHFPNHILKTISGANHNVHMDNPRDFAQQVEAFL